ncbi:MAG: PASTA domain-containing protein [Acidimicrobiales bacterium]
MTSQEGDAEIGRVLGGRYRIVAPIGVGASARAYLADDITLRRRVAVKVLHEALAADSGFLRRFRAEAQAAASLNHPNVLGVYDWGQDDVPFLVSEYLGGGSLQSMLDAGRRLTTSQALLVGLEAGRGLEYAHGQGLVHRDIKPANLLFDESGRLRIADFGLARALAEAGWTEPDGSMVGTARYAAPEQARGERVGPAADVYALALVVNEAVTGELPFTADTAIATLMARAETPFEPNPEVGPLAATLRGAGVLDPDQRPTATAFVRGFMAAAEDLPRPAPLPLVGVSAEAVEGGDRTRLVPTAVAEEPVVALAPPEDEGPSRRWPWIVALAVLLVAGVVGGVLAYQHNRTPTHEIPVLVGSTVDEATRAIEERGWVPDPVTIRKNGTVEGEVIAVDPEAGTRLAEGEIVTLTVSAGEERVPVPDLEGKSLEEATAELEGLGLRVGQKIERESEDIAAGAVIEPVLPPGESEVDPGSAVDLVISTGPAARVVPGVPESRDLQETRDLLIGLRLVPEEETAFSDDIEKGLVIELAPATGTEVDADSTVRIIVSDGPAPRVVPNTSGMSVDEATKALEDAGFTVSNVEGSPSFTVLETNPPAGETHPYRTPVTIITRGI